MAYDRAEITKEVFVTGLRNVHAVENQALALAGRQIDRLEHYPELSDRLRQHVDETKAQIQRVEVILATLGEKPSAVKDTVLSFMGNAAALGHVVAGDEVLKNTFASLAFENFEIASYKSLLALAELRFPEAVAHLTASLDEEKAMSSWLEAKIPMITERYVELLSSSETAKV